MYTRSQAGRRAETWKGLAPHPCIVVKNREAYLGCGDLRCRVKGPGTTRGSQPRVPALGREIPVTSDYENQRRLWLMGQRDAEVPKSSKSARDIQEERNCLAQATAPFPRPFPTEPAAGNVSELPLTWLTWSAQAWGFPETLPHPAFGPTQCFQGLFHTNSLSWLMTRTFLKSHKSSQTLTSSLWPQPSC